MLFQMSVSSISIIWSLKDANRIHACLMLQILSLSSFRKLSQHFIFLVTHNMFQIITCFISIHTLSLIVIKSSFFNNLSIFSFANHFDVASHLDVILSQECSLAIASFILIPCWFLKFPLWGTTKSENLSSGFPVVFTTINN